MLREKVAADSRPERLSSDIAVASLRSAEAHPSGLSTEHALALISAEEGPALTAVVRLADDLRKDAVGDEVTYVVNRNINFTNVCYIGCRFCAFAQRKTDADAYTLSLEEIANRARIAVSAGATDVRRAWRR
jgi:FO synthase